MDRNFRVSRVWRYVLTQFKLVVKFVLRDCLAPDELCFLWRRTTE
jgi:hypothetical protein